MPTYDYHCDACEQTVEIFHSIKDPPLTTCPKCGEEKLRRMLGSGGGLIFKGSGFYITDYRGDGYKKAAAGDSSSGDKSSGSSSEGSKSSDSSSSTSSSDSTSTSSSSTPASGSSTSSES